MGNENAVVVVFDVAAVVELVVDAPELFVVGANVVPTSEVVVGTSALPLAAATTVPEPELLLEDDTEPEAPLNACDDEEDEDSFDEEDDDNFDEEDEDSFDCCRAPVPPDAPPSALALAAAELSAPWALVLDFLLPAAEALLVACAPPEAVVVVCAPTDAAVVVCAPTDAAVVVPAPDPAAFELAVPLVPALAATPAPVALALTPLEA